MAQLALYDIKGGPGVAADIGHINTKSNVRGYDPTPEGLKECLGGAEVVCTARKTDSLAWKANEGQ